MATNEKNMNTAEQEWKDKAIQQGVDFQYYLDGISDFKAALKEELDNSYRNVWSTQDILDLIDQVKPKS